MEKSTSSSLVKIPVKKAPAKSAPAKKVVAPKTVSDTIVQAPKKVKKVDTYSYKWWLNSDSFLRRAFACLGYQFVAGLILWVLTWLGILIWFWILIAL